MENKRTLKVARPIGFCGGVRHAVNLFLKTADAHPGEPIFVLHELVHNRAVSSALEQRGAHYVDSLDGVPEGSLVFLGAHGVRPEIVELCHVKKFRLTNAVCPLVERLQMAVAEIPPEVPLLVFGDKKHPEVQGILGHAKSREVTVIGDLAEADALPPMEQAVLVSQTTRNAEEIQAVVELLSKRIKVLDSHNAHACDAVYARQKAVKDLAQECDLVLIIGSPHSSNARRLVEIAQHIGRTVLMEGAEELTAELVKDIRCLGVGAGTSTPDSVIDEVLQKAALFGFEENEK